MRYETVIELSEEFGVAVTVCTNSETVCSGLELGDCPDDYTAAISGAAIRAIENALGGSVNVDSFFANWHGGHFYKGMAQGLAHASFRRRDIDTDDEDPDYRVVGEWEWVGDNAVPPELVAKVQVAFDLACDAVAKEAAECEESFAKLISE